MRVDVFEVSKSPKSLLYKILGIVIIILGIVLAFDFIIRFFQFILGLIVIVIGLFVFNFENIKFKMFKF